MPTEIVGLERLKPEPRRSPTSRSLRMRSQPESNAKDESSEPPARYVTSPHKLQSCSQAAGLHISNWLDFGLDYAETLKRWRLAFEQQLPAIRNQGFDSAFIRLWRFYYWYCEAGFLTRRTDVCQLILEQT